MNDHRDWFFGVFPGGQRISRADRDKQHNQQQYGQPERSLHSFLHYLSDIAAGPKIIPPHPDVRWDLQKTGTSFFASANPVAITPFVLFVSVCFAIRIGMVLVILVVDL
ncbi:MAG: hypothetical protein Q7U75_14635, partial [Desulfobacterales bacterium]|nr:hypothetical protein [Desulfobacterales bacterium]